LEARIIVDGVATANLNRCIGCGNCVANCKENANRLVKREHELLPPKDTGALYTKIMIQKVGKWNMLKIGAKALLGHKV